MKVLLLHQYFVFPDTPGATRSYDLATSFIKNDIDVAVITSSSFLEGEFSSRWTVFRKDNIEMHVLRSDYSNNLSFGRRILIFLHFMYFTALRSLKIRADIVVATSTPITIGIPAIVKRMVQKTPFVFEVRDVWPEAPVAMGVIKSKPVIFLVEYLEKLIYRFASHIVTLSPDMQRSILQRTGVPVSKVDIISNISEVNRFSNIDPSSFRLRDITGTNFKRSLLYAGTLGEANGLRFLLAMAKVTSAIDPELKYILIGVGKMKEQLIKEAQEQGLFNKVVFFPEPVSKNILPQLYFECTAASSFVLPVPELWYNSANKYFDCLASGRPVVINYEGWQASEIREKNVGFVLNHDINNIEITARDFCAYMNNEALLAEQGNNALQLAKEKYSLQEATTKYVRVLRSVL